MDKGTLYIVATPIGNREDVTIRALKILFSVPVIACEDTRRTGLLLSGYRTEEPYLSITRSFDSNPKPKLISFYDEVEEQKIPEIIELLQSGNDVALVSDAGTPLISDPGFKLVRECYRQNISVSPIPGPSSITAALSASGLPTDRFLFIGYLPKKKGKREKLISQIKELKDSELVKTIVVLETPHHINQTLGELDAAFPELTVCIANELTKMFEKIIISSLPYPIKNPQGEYVVIIA
ncbi:MAG: 16S rRNA (cytidine(1402)-2'-O)-methyltransferase [Candidatus Roizmanbacteria bacterium]|nr:16S rRNA (cytidine(1402)-2'-O)-methyltransferase [Candidatus Roizmanbacteria bacterium]